MSAQIGWACIGGTISSAESYSSLERVLMMHRCVVERFVGLGTACSACTTASELGQMGMGLRLVHGTGVMLRRALISVQRNERVRVEEDLTCSLGHFSTWRGASKRHLR